MFSELTELYSKRILNGKDVNDTKSVLIASVVFLSVLNLAINSVKILKVFWIENVLCHINGQELRILKQKIVLVIE